jgi:hypothetical protein
VLECLGLSLRVAEWELWRWDGCSTGQTSIKALVGVSYLHGRQLLYLQDMGNLSSTHVGGSASCRELSLRVWAHTPVGAELVVRGGDLSCEADTCRARRTLVVGVSLVGELVGDAANWPLPVSVLTRVLTPPCPESLP